MDTQMDLFDSMMNQANAAFHDAPTQQPGNVPDGEYPACVIEAKGRIITVGLEPVPIADIVFLIIGDGDHAGRRVTKTLWLNDSGLGRAKGDLRFMGYLPAELPELRAMLQEMENRNPQFLIKLNTSKKNGRQYCNLTGHCDLPLPEGLGEDAVEEAMQVAF